MKNYLNCLWMAAVMLLSFAACDEDPVNKKDTGYAEGTLELSALKASLVVNVTEEQKSAGDTRADIDVSEYKVRIYKTDSDVSVYEWGYSAVPEIITLEVGDYRVEAHSQDLDLTTTGTQPYYAGFTNVTIVENEITPIEAITCTFQNIKVQIVCTEDLISKLDPGYRATVNIGGIEYIFTENMLDPTQDNFVFFPSKTGSDIMIVLMEGEIDGEYVSSGRKSYQNIQKGEYWKITFDVLDNGIDDNDEGQMGVSLSINMTCEEIIRNVSIPAEETPLPDEGGGTDPVDPEPGDENPITIESLTFNIEEPQYIPNGGSITVIVNMSTPNGIKNLFVQIDSDVLQGEELESLKLSDYFDLAYPDNEDMNLALKRLGFPVGEDVIGKTQVPFDISEFTVLLDKLPVATHKFILTVIDNQNYELTKTLTLITQ